jgi:hypothetical protein
MLSLLAKSRESIVSESLISEPVRVVGTASLFYAGRMFE